MEMKRRNVGGRPRKDGRASNGKAVVDWGRHKGPLVMMRGEDEFGRQAIIVKDDTPGNERRAPMIITPEKLAQLSLIVAETLQLENPTEAWAQMRLAQLLATCDPTRVDAALAMLQPPAGAANEIQEIFGVLDNAREAITWPGN